MMLDTNRNFNIELDKNIGIKDMVQALCHEMVHVKQYARNEMNDGIVKGKARWKKQFIAEDTNYWDLPWEKDAYRMEKKLADDVWENGLMFDNVPIDGWAIVKCVSDKQPEIVSLHQCLGNAERKDGS